MNCKKCGNIIEKNKKYCSFCGEKILDELQNKVNVKKIILIISIFSILLFCIFILNITSKLLNEMHINNKLDNYTEDNNINNNDYFEDSEQKKKKTYELFEQSKIVIVANSDHKLTNGIIINKIFFNALDEKIYIYGENKNSEAVHTILHLEYYDHEGYRIKKNSNDIVVSSDKEFVIDLKLEDDSLKYEKVKLFYEASQLKSYETDVSLNEIDVDDYKLNDGNIRVILKNNANTNIFSGMVACLYYKNKELIYATNSHISTTNAGEIEEIMCYAHQLILSKDYNYNTLEKIEYDNFKIVLFSAYDYDSENY